MRVLLSLLIITVCYCQAYSQAPMRFDGIDDYIYVNSYPSLNWERDFTLEAQVLQPDFSSSAVLTIAERYHSEKQEGWRLQLTATSLNLLLGKHTFSVPCDLEKEMNLAVVRQGELLSFYGNGALLGTQPVEVAVFGACTSCDLLLGNQQDLAAPFKGALQGLKLWNKALSLEELSAPLSSKGLIGYWNFAEGEGQFVNNLAAPLHYGRLGKTFYEDEQDPVRVAFLKDILMAAAPTFEVTNQDPKEGAPLSLLNTTPRKGSFYWLINGEKYTPEQLSTTTFASGMNIIQLVEEATQGYLVTTKMVTIKAQPKACGAEELQLWRVENDLNRKSSKSKPILSKSQAKNGSSVVSGGPYVIPVVFHIIGTQPELDAFNLASGRVEAQLLELNDQFTNNSTNIRFCLAQRLPIELVNAGRTWASFGTAATPGRAGVTYTLDDATTNLDISTFDLSDNDLVYNKLPTLLPFAPEKYMSVYVAATVLLPNGAPVLGVANVGSTGEPVDGPGVTHAAFTDASTGVLGRTLVHEVGHWLSLYHVFGESGDLVEDTYEHQLPTNTIPQNPNIQPVTNCTTAYTTGIPTVPYVPYYRGQNHMDYHFEYCKDVFTAGQSTRMHVNLESDRTYISTELNLINTGVQDLAPTSCVVGNNFTANFALSSGEVCEGNAFTGEGFTPAPGVTATYAWNVSWSASNTGSAPAFSVIHSNQTGNINDITITGTAGTAAGWWTVELTVVSGGTTLVSTSDIHLLDCSVSPERFRKTTNFDDTDWELEGISIANGSTRDISNNLVDGYVVVGTDLSTTPARGVLLFVNTIGEILWRKTIATSTGSLRLYDVTAPISFQGNPNCYAMTGYIESNGIMEVLVVITDELGVTLYQESFPISDGGVTHPFAMGKQITQLSSAFGNQLAVVGLAGDGANLNGDRVGVVLGIDPTQSSGSTLEWSHFYETTITPIGVDNDFVENIVETTATIGGVQKDVLLVSGNCNRYLMSTSGMFISCLTVTANVVTEEWMTVYDSRINTGSYEVLGTAEDNGRVFITGYGQISHGTFICEVNTTDGTLGDVFEVQNFVADEILLDGGYCVLFGRHYADEDVNAFKMALPATFNGFWGLPNTATTRRYERTNNTSTASMIYDKGLQNFVKSPNGGYMGITTVEMIKANNIAAAELSIIKVDEFLVNGCANLTDFVLRYLPNPFGSTPVIETPTETAAANTITLTATTEGVVCVEDGCLDAYHFNKYEQKCVPTLLLMVSDVITTDPTYAYQWSPATDLDDPTILEPTTSTTIDQNYSLIVTNTITGCQVASVSYSITVPTTTYSTSPQQIVCNTAPATPFPLNLIAGVQTGYTYSWTPAAFLDNTNVLQPNCSAVTNQTYTLTAVPISGSGNCHTIVTTLEVLVNNQIIQEKDGFCIDETYAGYFFDASQSGIWQDRLDLDILYTHFYTAPLPTGGYWIVETFGSNQALYNVYNSLPRFDVANNSVGLGIINTGQVEYLTYIYPDPSSACGDSRLRIKLYPDNSITGNAALEICAGETVNFQGSAITLDPSLNPSTYWGITSTLNCTSTNPNYPFGLLSNPPLGTFSHTFLSAPSCYNYTVSRQLRYECPDPNNPGNTIMKVAPSNNIYVDVLSEMPVITLEDCLGTLGVTYFTSSSPAIYWYEVGNPVAIATGNTFLPAHPGDYYVEVVSSQGCDFVTPTFNYQGPLSSTLTATTLACATSTATATVTPVGGQSPYTYLWSNAQTTATAIGLTAGTYTVTVTDANSCETQNTVSIVAGAPLQVQLTATQISCAIANSAAISSTRSNGTAPYTYLWSTGATTPDLTGAQIPASGNYCVTVTDANGCVATACATINPLVDVDFSKTTAVTQAQAGDEIVYTIFMKNNCQYPVSFDLVDVLPAGVLPTQIGAYTYDASAHILHQRITLQGGAMQNYDYKVLIVVDGACNRSLTLDNQITAQSIENPSIILTRNALVEVTEDRDDCDLSSLDVTFAQAIQAGVLLPMTGSNNATNTPQTVVINGTWRLRPGQVYNFAPGSNVIMEAGAQIIISKDAILNIEETVVNGCSCLWHRILVKPRGTLNVTNHSLFQDAQYAIETENTANLTITESRFENNFIGWYTAPVNNPLTQQVYLHAFDQNYFSSRGLKLVYSGAPLTPALDENGQQTTIAVPSTTAGNRYSGLAGVYLWDMKDVRIEANQPADHNRFENLVTGIASFDSKLYVNNGTFHFIRENTNLYATDLAFQGAAIHGQGAEGRLGYLEVVGTVQTNNATTFSHSDIGVSGLSVTLDVEHCIMEQIYKVGIKSHYCSNTANTIKANRLTDVYLLGIDCNSNAGATAQTVIAYNEVISDYSAANAAQFRAGISLQSCTQVITTLNYIESFSSRYGIYSTNVFSGDINRNEVYMVGTYNGSTRTGMAIIGGQTGVTCNVIHGTQDVRLASNTIALSGTNLDLGDWKCNQLSSTYTGAYFEGSNGVSFEGNVFNTHHTGLLLSSNATIGVQYEAGNVWVPGTMTIDAENQNTGNLSASLFEVNPAFSVPNTWPSTIIPNNNNWFVQTSGPDNTFNCNTAANEMPFCGEPLDDFPSRTVVANNTAATANDGHSTKDKDNKEAWNLVVYPNPAFQYLTLESNQNLSKACQVEVYNALGQLMPTAIQVQTTQQVILDVSKLTPGFYTVRLIDQGEQFNQTFVVSKP